MNTKQREYLISKIENESRKQIEELEGLQPEAPNLAAYLMQAIVSNTIQFKPLEAIRESLHKRATDTTDADWIQNGSEEDSRQWRNGRYVRVKSQDSKPTITVTVGTLFVIPEEFRDKYDKYLAKKDVLEQAIKAVEIQSESIITRIHLADDKILNKLIAEVNDMGDLSFMDESLRLMSKVDANTQLLLTNSRKDRD